MTRFLLFSLILFILTGCDQKGTEAPTISDNTVKTDSFFPVTSFIKGQILTLDFLPITPLLITSSKGQTDSTWIPASKLDPVWQSFLQPEIKETNLTSYFQQTRFHDQTINAITFTYEPKAKLPESITLRHWDVYIDPEKGTVSKVYIVKNVKENNQLLTLQLTWQTDKLAKIVTLLNKPDGNLELLKEDLVTWKF